MQSQQTILRRMRELEEQLQYHAARYYCYDDPEITDEAYDALYQSLVTLEKAHPDWVSPSSPTQRIVGTVQTHLKASPHLQPMLSLENAYSETELHAFLVRTQPFTEQLGFCCEPKIDGLAVSLRYESGQLAAAITRGDGRVGESVLQQIKTIRSIPLKLLTELPFERLEVRGEVFMTERDFQRNNEELAKENKPLFANPRNAAAGSLRQLDFKKTSQRRLKFYAYGIGSTQGVSLPQSQYEQLQYLKTLGLPVPKEVKHCQTEEEIFAFYQGLMQARPYLGFGIDGMVVKVNATSAQRYLASTQRAPKWALAYKFPAQEAQTTIEKVQFTVGRTGVITPVATLRPVGLGGVTVRSATLHNMEEVKRLEIGLGSHVWLRRAGDVIPKIVKKVNPAEPITCPIEVPKVCPSCQEPLIQAEALVAVRCVAGLLCPAQRFERLKQFVSKPGLNIVGLGPQTLLSAVELGLIKTPVDIFLLSEAQWMQCEKIGARAAANLIKAIDRSKTVRFSAFIFALGIRGIGVGIADRLAEHFTNWQALKRAQFAEIEAIAGVGTFVAQHLMEFLSLQDNIQVCEQLLTSPVALKLTALNTVQVAQPDPAVKALNVCITGEFEELTRGELTQKLKSAQVTVQTNVLRSTEVLIVGKHPGSKLQKAQRAGIRICSLKAFLAEYPHLKAFVSLQ